jgi:hypothetical protein
LDWRGQWISILILGLDERLFGWISWQHLTILIDLMVEWILHGRRSWLLVINLIKLSEDILCLLNDATLSEHLVIEWLQ